MNGHWTHNESHHSEIYMCEMIGRIFIVRKMEKQQTNTHSRRENRKFGTKKSTGNIKTYDQTRLAGDEMVRA